MVVGGEAKGRLLVLTDPDEDPVGRIDILTGRFKTENSDAAGSDMAGFEMTVCEGNISVSNGVWALYFRYEGDGAIDLYEFQFL